MSRAASHVEALGENPFIWLSQLLETTCIPLLLVPFSVFKYSSVAFSLLSHLCFHLSVFSLLLHSFCFMRTLWITLSLSRYSGLPRWLRIHPQCRKPGFYPRIEKILWSRKWQPTSVFLPRESHEQRSLEDYSPWGRKESDTTEQLHFWLGKGRSSRIHRVQRFFGRGVSLSLFHLSTHTKCFFN